MNLEEAKANIGKEVVLDESTNPYKNGTLILLISSNDFIKGVLLDVDHYSTAKVDTLDGFHLFINIEHIKLKEQPMQNYKIKVTPETSAEVQELFFELGYRWLTQDDDSQEPKYTNTREYIFAYQDNMKLTAPYLGLGKFDLQLNQEITLPKLRDLVVLKRNDVDYLYHVGKDVVYKGRDVLLCSVEIDGTPVIYSDAGRVKVKKSELSLKKQIHENYKVKVDDKTKVEALDLLQKIRESRGSNKEKPRLEEGTTKLYLHNENIISGMSGFPFDDEYFEKFDGIEVTVNDLFYIAHGNKEMTWQDALRAVADGKDVERFKDDEWQLINDSFKYSRYRLKPQTTHIEGGDYTKEELLKIVGDMG